MSGGLEPERRRYGEFLDRWRSRRVDRYLISIDGSFFLGKWTDGSAGAPRRGASSTCTDSRAARSRRPRLAKDNVEYGIQFRRR